jgi:putative polyhydroxyalkanoate system protein
MREFSTSRRFASAFPAHHAAFSGLSSTYSGTTTCRRASAAPFARLVHRKARDSRTRILWVAHKRWERPVATISIAKNHRLSHKKAKDAAEEIARDLKSRFALDYVWNGDRIDFERPGVSGSMHVRKDQIQLDVSLSFLLTPIKPSIEREIHAQLERLLGDKPKSAKA